MPVNDTTLKTLTISATLSMEVIKTFCKVYGMPPFKLVDAELSPEEIELGVLPHETEEAWTDQEYIDYAKNYAKGIMEELMVPVIKSSVVTNTDLEASQALQASINNQQQAVQSVIDSHLSVGVS